MEERIFNPPFSDLLLKWDNLAIAKGRTDIRKTVWAIADLMDGARWADPGAIVADLQKWNQTGEVKDMIEYIKSGKWKKR